MPSKSQAQQKFMGMVHALKKGEMDPKDASPELKKAAQSMKKSDAKDFASTKHKGLPKKVKQEILNKLKEYANKMGRDHLGGDDYTSSKKGGLRDFDGYDNVDYNKDMPMDESNLKGQLAGDSVQDIIKSIGSRFVSGEIKNTKRDGKTYIKLKDEKFGSGVVKILKSRFGIDAKVDYYGGKGKVASSPSVSFYSDTILEGVFSTIDHIRQNSKSVRDFIKNVLSDKDFRDMKNDKDFIKYLGSIYEGTIEESHYTAVANLGTKKAKENLDSFDELQKFMDKMKSRKAISVQVTKINGSKKQTIDYDWDGRNWVSKGKKGVKENFPSNWLQGRTSDYHTKLRGKKRQYDDTNFDKENSGQPDLEEATKPDYSSKGYKDASNLVSKLRSSTFRKYNDNELEQFRMVIAQAFDLKESVNESGYTLDDLIGQVKTFNKPKTQKSLTIYVINKLKEKRNNSKSKSNQVKIQKLIDKIEGDYKRGKYLKEFGSKLTEPFLLPKDEDKLKGTPPSKDAIDRVDEVMITLTQNIAQEIIPMNTWSRYASDGKKNAEFVKNLMRDLTQTLNKFYKSHDINVRVKEK